MKKNVASLLIAGGVALAAPSAFGETEIAPRNEPDARRPGAAMGAEDEPAGGGGMDRGANEVAPDNSGKNVRDRSATALTPGDQSNSERDVEITRQIRQAVVSDPDLSVNAQNIKIITINGVVTLRGPVENAAERQNIAAAAKKVAGVTRVDNQLELTGE